MADPSDTSSDANRQSPPLPEEVKSFRETNPRIKGRLTKDEYLDGLRGTEVKDKRQKVWLRPWFAGGVYVLLLAQNLGIFLIVMDALHRGVLASLQLIFATLVAGTLTQSYLILRLIAEKVFGEIAYDNKDS